MREHPFVSIIIPSLNVEKYIEDCLDAIHMLYYPKDKLEIILVDNGSTDRTRKIASTCGARVLIRRGCNISALRNFGVSQSKGEIIAFLDADCIVSKDWLKVMLLYKRAKIHFTTRENGSSWPA